MPDACASWFLPRIVGLPKALEWTYSGELIDAPTALAHGLANRVAAGRPGAGRGAALRPPDRPRAVRRGHGADPPAAVAHRARSEPDAGAQERVARPLAHQPGRRQGRRRGLHREARRRASRRACPTCPRTSLGRPDRRIRPRGARALSRVSPARTARADAHRAHRRRPVQPDLLRQLRQPRAGAAQAAGRHAAAGCACGRPRGARDAGAGRHRLAGARRSCSTTPSATSSERRST